MHRPGSLRPTPEQSNRTDKENSRKCGNLLIPPFVVGHHRPNVEEHRLSSSIVPKVKIGDALPHEIPPGLFIVSVIIDCPCAGYERGKQREDRGDFHPVMLLRGLLQPIQNRLRFHQRDQLLNTPCVVCDSRFHRRSGTQRLMNSTTCGSKLTHYPWAGGAEDYAARARIGFFLPFAEDGERRPDGLTVFWPGEGGVRSLIRSRQISPSANFARISSEPPKASM